MSADAEKQNDTSNLNIGNMNLEKGMIRKDVKFYAWDCIRECTGGIFEVDENDPNPPVRCSVSHLCSYVKRGKCAVQVKYLENLYSAILGTYTYLDEPMLFKIGMQVVPLYAQLVKLQLVELGLNTPTFINSKGNPDIHPIYKEIRETLKAIHVMWKDLDLSLTFNPKVRLKPEGKEGGDDERGDPTFYKRLIGSDQPSQKGVIR
ncbi:MAG: hypothetical protein WC346_00310 [Methanogenium sp.]|jgi:hypothetical protein